MLAGGGGKSGDCETATNGSKYNMHVNRFFITDTVALSFHGILRSNL